MSKKTAKYLKNITSGAVILITLGSIAYLVAKYAPEDPFADSAFVRDVANIHRY